MRTKLTTVVAGLGFLLAARPTVAHHSFAAEFDATQPVTLKGTVVQMDWVNPHSWIHVDVKNEDGTVTRWMVEGGTPNTLFRRGFNKDSLKAGTEITRSTSLAARTVSVSACANVKCVSKEPAGRLSTP